MHHFASILWNRTTLACSAAAMATLLLVQVAFMRPAQAESVQGNSGISQARSATASARSSPRHSACG
jgi:hypothetical protein